MFDQAVAIGEKRLAGQTPSLGERFLDPALHLLVRAKMRKRFGGRLKVMLSGGAPLNPEIARFFLALGVTLLQGYGQTEAGPAITCNPPTRIKTDTVGPALEGVQLCIAGDGEILVVGDNVMKGYWNDLEATVQALSGGWLHTGDIGAMGDDGYLRIIDRKRDFIKNSGGEMISPARVEGYLALEPELSQAIVFGDQRPYLVAIVVPDPEFVAGYTAEGTQPDLTALAADPGFNKAIAAAIARVNRSLTPSEQVRRFLIASEPFTIDNGLMTPTLKIKRHAIRDAYGSTLEALYQTREAAA